VNYQLLLFLCCLNFLNSTSIIILTLTNRNFKIENKPIGSTLSLSLSLSLSLYSLWRKHREKNIKEF
ncbi:MAG: hypothetical protein J8272_00505, partial ['Prunus persica' phytoplasma PP2]|nr:hypothetical protein ['Prunus persica' phytoplasma PP2]